MIEGANGIDFQGIFTRDMKVNLYGEEYKFRKGQKIAILLIDVSPVQNKGPLEFVTVVTFLADLSNTGEYVMFSLRLNFDIMLTSNPDEEPVNDDTLVGKNVVGCQIIRDCKTKVVVEQPKSLTSTPKVRKKIKDSDFAKAEFE